ncbi:MAG: manganese efflux pump MntP family protein [Bacteroidales bacterium]|nr:manganese efflux pump MntP family protein [Bacteroidales bacterium]
MDFITILGIGVALSMDAFSVSICKGLATKKFSFRTAVICGIWFGGFQALMPVIGYFLGAQFEHLIVAIDHWIAFGLLLLIGANMIREAFSDDESEKPDSTTGFKTMFLLAVATSIDALAVGVSFAFLQVNILIPILIIGVTTFIFSFGGVAIGNFFGSRYSKPAEITGGVILILLGTKILLEHLNVI